MVSKLPQNGENSFPSLFVDYIRAKRSGISIDHPLSTIQWQRANQIAKVMPLRKVEIGPRGHQCPRWHLGVASSSNLQGFSHRRTILF